MNKVQYFLLLLVVQTVVSCNSGVLFEKKVLIPEEGWTYNDNIQFEFNINDTLTVYNLNLKVNHSRSFPYQNLYTNIHTTFPDGQKLSQTVSFELAGKGGIWQGQCNNHSCELNIPIQTNAYFNQKGKYTIAIEQFMRNDSIQGINALALEIEQTENRR